MLLVREDARVEVGLESVPLLAIWAESRLLDASEKYGSLFFPEALSASEVSLFHLRDDITVANDDASQ